MRGDSYTLPFNASCDSPLPVLKIKNLELLTNKKITTVKDYFHDTEDCVIYLPLLPGLVKEDSCTVPFDASHCGRDSDALLFKTAWDNPIPVISSKIVLLD